MAHRRLSLIGRLRPYRVSAAERTGPETDPLLYVCVIMWLCLCASECRSRSHFIPKDASQWDVQDYQECIIRAHKCVDIWALRFYFSFMENGFIFLVWGLKLDPYFSARFPVCVRFESDDLKSAIIHNHRKLQRSALKHSRRKPKETHVENHISLFHILRESHGASDWPVSLQPRIWILATVMVFHKYGFPRRPETTDGMERALNDTLCSVGIFPIRLCNPR